MIRNFNSLDELYLQHLAACAAHLKVEYGLPKGGPAWFKQNAESNRKRFGSYTGAKPRILSM